MVVLKCNKYILVYLALLSVKKCLVINICMSNMRPFAIILTPAQTILSNYEKGGDKRGEIKGGR